MTFYNGFDDNNFLTIQGDSGGPLLDKNNLQIGVVSFGPDCPRNNKQPGVYSTIADNLNWINSIVSGNNKNGEEC